ncbi:dynamin family protein, partial [Paenibacillus sp. DMB20]|uniref:dynamin family protein n=1 Tax=Paenibacillus sp. DMB20 TaxID=1642570 RepID=UPI00062809D9
ALLAPYPALASAARDLTARADALAGGSFTLALFGAFSAGKSSFANALLGESVLPVSPHPTTAAVNRILAPAEGHPHGTADVRMKTREAWWDDLKYSFSVLGLPEPEADGWRRTADNLTPDGVHPAGLPHYGFLKAAAAGWEEMNGKLGRTESVDLEAYKGFVADETKSCYVDGIDLYYSCPLTEQGIILVDTPGADSLHARHTGVTFSYIKNADAICYVTYYNHAFSKADRQFLSQLGRVKDSFALDKMFFVVNAADLASSPDELEQVTGHVRDNLVKNGVTRPHIFPVSSLNALRGKLSGNHGQLEVSGFVGFEAALDRFAVEELPGLSLRAGLDDIASAKRKAEAWAALAEQDEDSRSRRVERLESVRQEAMDRLEALTKLDLSRELSRECAELLFHVRQRLDYAMGRFFQESFHPSVLREDAASLKRAFAACGRDLERTLAVELDQELWATTLRLEGTGHRLAEDAARAIAADICGLEESLEIDVRQGRNWTAPQLEETTLVLAEDWTTYWPVFKNPKFFFEGKGSQKLREAAEPKVKEVVAAVLKEREAGLARHYAEETGKALRHYGAALRDQLEESLQALLVSLQGGQSPEVWRKLSADLAELQEEPLNP